MAETPGAVDRADDADWGWDRLLRKPGERLQAVNWKISIWSGRQKEKRWVPYTGQEPGI